MSEDQVFILTMTDTFFGLPLGIMGVVNESEVEGVLEGVVDPSDDWAVCRNGCCQSRAGVGEFEGVLFKLVPSRPTPAEVREEVLGQRDNIAQIREEAAQYAEAFIPMQEVN